MLRARNSVLTFVSLLRKMAGFCLKPRIFRAQGQNGVRWVVSDFSLNTMERPWLVIWRRASLGRKYDDLDWTLLHYIRPVADNGTT